MTLRDAIVELIQWEFDDHVAPKLPAQIAAYERAAIAHWGTFYSPQPKAALSKVE